MTVQRKQYTPEFKREAIRLVTQGGVSMARAARDLGVSRSLLGKWKRQIEAEAQVGLRAFPGHGNPADEELVRLRRENAVLREERDILKKAALILGQQRS
jgi:transposase